MPQAAPDHPWLADRPSYGSGQIAVLQLARAIAAITIVARTSGKEDVAWHDPGNSGGAHTFFGLVLQMQPKPLGCSPALWLRRYLGRIAPAKIRKSKSASV